MKQAAYIITDGPYPDQNAEGDEIPIWVASTCTEDDVELEHHSFTSYESCYQYGEDQARIKHIEHVPEGMRA